MEDLSQLRSTLKSLADSANDKQLVEAVFAVIAPYRRKPATNEAMKPLPVPKLPRLPDASDRMGTTARRLSLADKILGLK